LSGSNSPAFPPDEMECVRLLCRMAANQPTLTLMTQMQRQIPLRADRWMSLTDRSHRAVDQLELPYDPDLALRLANEIRLKRRYALDHVAIVELDELGVDRIILSPEERADDGSNIGVNALVEHRLGAFAVRTVIQTPDGPAREAQEPVTGSGSPTLTFAPAFMTERTMDECSSPLELVVLSAWRDLVVADVREQQYEIEMQRKARGKGRKRLSRPL